jgi:hypothetical protein
LLADVPAASFSYTRSLSRRTLDKPDNPVALKVTMHALPDGTSYPGNVVLSIKSSNIEVRIAKSNYQRLAP